MGSTAAPATRRPGGGSGGGKGNGGAAGVGNLGSLAPSHGTAFCVGSVCTTGTGGGLLRGRPRFGRYDDTCVHGEEGRPTIPSFEPFGLPI